MRRAHAPPTRVKQSESARCLENLREGPGAADRPPALARDAGAAARLSRAQARQHRRPSLEAPRRAHHVQVERLRAGDGRSDALRPPPSRDDGHPRTARRPLVLAEPRARLRLRPALADIRRAQRELRRGRHQRGRASCGPRRIPESDLPARRRRALAVPRRLVRARRKLGRTSARAPDKISGLLNEIKRVLSRDGVALLCESACEAGAPSRHCWDRSPSFYEQALDEWRLDYCSYIDELDSIPGMTAPCVMLFVPRSPGA